MPERLVFESHGTRCAATLYLPEGPTSPPCVLMGHGFTGTQDQLEYYAVQFAEAGFAGVTFDYATSGEAKESPASS